MRFCFGLVVAGVCLPGLLASKDVCFENILEGKKCEELGAGENVETGYVAPTRKENWWHLAEDLNVPPVELSALQDLYYATNGEQWSWKEGSRAEWNFTGNPNPCSENWQGIVCSHAQLGDPYLHVEEVVLPSYDLEGTIPSSLSNLSEVKILDLRENALVGAISFNLRALPSLTALRLDSNYLSGTVPSSVELLDQLITLDLSTNSFTGTIPVSVGLLEQLTSLDLSTNALTGTIPVSVGSLAQLTSLDLSANSLTGSIPASSCNLSSIQRVSLFTNMITGAIPTNIGDLSLLIYLSLSENLLTGSIPSTTEDLKNLVNLYLNKNSLSGSLPSILGSLKVLVNLELDNNLLSGSIPASFGNLTTLHTLYLDNNMLTGEIPINFGSMEILTALYLNNNALSGTIPNELSSLVVLEELALHDNSLSGKIPPGLGALPLLHYINCAVNFLTGPVPSSFGSLKLLIKLVLFSNHLSSTIPSSLGNLTVLTDVELGFNALTGTIPYNIGDLRVLSTLELLHNYLTGVIPISIGDLRVLANLALGYNAFTGTLPSNMGNLILAVALSVASNQLTGTIPTSIHQCKLLQELYADNNFLSGTVPTGIGELPALIYVSLFNNSLGGNLDGVFNSKVQLNLYQVDIHNNHLTGSLPTELFRLPALSIAALASNCFTGTLPADVCQPVSLQTLILDGLHTASSCKKKIWALSESYVVIDGIHGIIPACVFALPQLQTLHLSGNGFTGTLPHELQLSYNLTDLTMSHNSLTGTIPASFQFQHWKSLDLSYNRLSGSLYSQFGDSMPSNGTVYLQNNRLSGKVPSYLVQLNDVSLLGSNMFSCTEDKDDLPQHDSSTDNYQCGSDAFNEPFYALIIAIVVIVALNFAWFHSELLPNTEFIRHRWEKYCLPENSLPSNCRQVYAMAKILCQVSIISTIIIVLVLVPWYVIAHQYWGTYTHSYAWVVSASFISGLTPGVVDMCLYIIIFAVLILLILTWGYSKKYNDVDSVPSDQPMSVPLCSSITLVYGIMLTINVIVVIGANTAFIFATLRASNSVLTLVQILLSLFKYGWNTFYVKRMDKWATKLLGHRDTSTAIFLLQTSTSLFNNIVVPCLVVTVLSPSCFYAVFDTPQDVTSDYKYSDCALVSTNSSSADLKCTIEEVSSTYQPPYSYDYQCSSSFITYYAPTFVYLAMMASILSPIAGMFVLYILNQTSNSSIRKVLISLLPTLLRPATSTSIDETYQSTVLWDANSTISSLFMYLGILFSFGVIFPPLAAAMCFTILSVVLQTKVWVGRLISKAKDESEERYQQVLRKLDEGCRGVASVEKFRSGLTLLIGCAFFFYLLFVFDSVGDAEGFGGAYWVLIVMPLVPACLTGLVRICKYLYKRSQKRTFDSAPGIIQFENRINHPSQQNITQWGDAHSANRPINNEETMAAREIDTVNALHSEL